MLREGFDRDPTLPPPRPRPETMADGIGIWGAVVSSISIFDFAGVRVDLEGGLLGIRVERVISTNLMNINVSVDGANS
jgi:hypothetical protein